MGMDLAVVPVLQAEITPAQNRGFTVGTYQLIISISQIIANGVARGTDQIESNWGWRIPLLIFFVAPSIVVSTIWFVPESPRWLILQDQREEGEESLRRLLRGKFTEEEIITE